MRIWKNITEHKFPWEPSRLVVAACDRGGNVDTFLCTCSKGFYYPVGSIIALNEDDLYPFSWTEAPPDMSYEDAVVEFGKHGSAEILNEVKRMSGELTQQ